MPLHLHVILDTYFLHQSLGFHYISKIAMSINLYAKWHIEVSIKILLKPECHAHMVSEKEWEVKTKSNKIYQKRVKCKCLTTTLCCLIKSSF